MTHYEEHEIERMARVCARCGRLEADGAEIVVMCETCGQPVCAKCALAVECKQQLCRVCLPKEVGELVWALELAHASFKRITRMGERGPIPTGDMIDVLQTCEWQAEKLEEMHI